MIGDLPANVIESDKGKPTLAPEPFASYGEVQTYAKAMISADDRRAGDRARVDGLINGQPPIDPSALKAKKLSWVSNVNFREAAGYIHAPQTAFYDLVTEANPCISVQLDYGEGQEKTDWEASIARNWTWLMFKRWRIGFNYHLPMCQREMLVHGMGCHVWPQMKVNNWIERTPRTGHILFPEDTSVDFENEGEAFMLRDFVSMHNLRQFIKNESAAKTLGWNPDIVWKTMALVSKNSREIQSGMNIEAYVREMKRGDTGNSTSRTSGVWINWVFVREIDSCKVSLYAVPETIDAGGYLFKKRNLYDQWPLAMFPYDIGNGSIHTIRGLGRLAADFFQLSNRIKNTMANQVLMGALIMLKQTGTIDPAKLKLLKMGMMGILPQNTDIAQGLRFPDLSQGPLALDQNLHDTLRNNTQAYANGAPEAKDRETALSYAMRAQDSSQVSKGAHGLYGSHLCHYWATKFHMVNKAAKMSGDKPYIVMAKEFRERCRKDGVPDEAFDHVAEITEVLSTGAGSASARIQAFMALMQSPVYANTSDDRQVNIERDFTSALFSGSKVDRYARSLDDGDQTDNDDTIIAIENNDLSSGGQCVVSPRQNQIKHAEGHLRAAGEVLMVLQQGQMPPETALSAIQAFGQHVSDHLKHLQTNPTKEGEFKRLQKELNALGAIADKIQSQIEQAQDDEPPPQQMMSEKAQIDMMKAQSQERVRNLKLEGSEARNWEKLQFEQRIADAKTAAEIARNNAKQLALTR